MNTAEAMHDARAGAHRAGGAHAAQSGAGSERRRHAERIAAALRGQAPPAHEGGGRLHELAARFGLDAFECDTLALLWAGAFDPELRTAAASREPYAGQITARLVARLFGHRERVRLNSESPLLAWLMVAEHPLIDGSAALAIDPAVVSWLEGEHQLDAALRGRVQLLAPGLEMPSWGLARLAAQLAEGWQRGARWQLQCVGPDLHAARALAAALGRQLALPVLAVRHGVPLADGELVLRLHRQAYLDHCVPFVALGTAASHDDAALVRPAGVQAFPLQIVHAQTFAALPAAGEGVQPLAIELNEPDAEERQLAWQALWPAMQAWPAHEREALVLGHAASLAEIAAAAAHAPADAAAAAAHLREAAREGAPALTRRIDAGFGWDDLVLPAATLARLHELAFEARERARVWAEPAAARLFPYGRGLVALFAGPPGTGKTMAAQVIARELGLDLLAVDLSAVVSKWVGETAQHLQQLLASRAAQRAVLFFDEADALYAKRVEEVRDAQDRFANLDTSHLMTALEAYPGIVLLASNLKANIDAAFLRRIRHLIEFARPDAAARLRLWQQVVQALFGADEMHRLDGALERLARIEATGAVIKNAALSALFKARQLGGAPSLELIGEMLARELAKEGAGLSGRELQWLSEAPR